jgi:membrane protein
MFIRYKEVIAFFLLTLIFSLLYFFVAKGVFSSRLFRWDKSAKVKLASQIPGAAIAAAGWILFSFFYSLYFENFPRLSFLYGGLAAIVFFMLWIYFCMLILLSGAEINKLLSERDRKKQTNTAQG